MAWSLLLFIVTNIVATFGQLTSDVCLWNIVGGSEYSYMYLNGLYEYQGIYLNVNPFYASSELKCGGTGKRWIYYKLRSWYIGLEDPRNYTESTAVRKLVGWCNSTDTSIDYPTGFQSPSYHTRVSLHIDFVSVIYI